jgi:hypothetical protein
MIEDSSSSPSSSSSSSSITLPYSLEIRLRSATTKTGFFERRKRIRKFHITMYYENRVVYRTISQHPEWNSLVVLPLCEVNPTSLLCFELYMNKYFRVPQLLLPLPSSTTSSSSTQRTIKPDGIAAGSDGSNVDLIGLDLIETEKEENKRNAMLGQRKVTVGKLLQLSKQYPEITVQLKPPSARRLLWTKNITQAIVDDKQRSGAGQKINDVEEAEDKDDFPFDSSDSPNSESFQIKNLDSGEVMHLKDFSKQQHQQQQHQQQQHQQQQHQQQQRQQQQSVNDTTVHEEGKLVQEETQEETLSDEEADEIASAMASARLVISTKLRENILFEILNQSSAYELLLSSSDISYVLSTLSNEIQEKCRYFRNALSFSFQQIFSFYYHYHLFLVSFDMIDNNRNIVSLLKHHQKKMPFLLNSATARQEEEEEKETGGGNSSSEVRHSTDEDDDEEEEEQEAVYYPHSRLSYYVLYSFHQYFSWKESEKLQKEYFLSQLAFYERKICQENHFQYSQKVQASSLLDPINDDIHSHHLIHSQPFNSSTASSLLFPFPSLNTGGLTIVFLNFSAVVETSPEHPPSSSSSSSLSGEAASQFETKEIYLTFASLLQYYTFLGELSFFFSNDSDPLGSSGGGESSATASKGGYDGGGSGKSNGSTTAQMHAKVNTNVGMNEWEDCFIFLEKESQSLSISSLDGAASSVSSSSSSNRFYFRAFFHQVRILRFFMIFLSYALASCVAYFLSLSILFPFLFLFCF